jgi:hypothetical protein
MKNGNFELIANVIEWGRVRGIHDQSTYEAQINGAMAEWFEVREAIIKGKEWKEIALEIGDVIVQIINAIMIQDRDRIHIVHNVLDAECTPSLTTADLDIELETRIFLENILEDRLAMALASVRDVATWQGLELSHCLRLAYDKIKDRKGSMKNGKWCKE